MAFNTEAEFEKELISTLQEKGWGDYPVLEYKSEEDLIQNWAEILFENNRGIDRLNNQPLTDNEMQQILDQINTLKTPLKLNEFINNTITITRDNPNDHNHLGKDISLKLYDRTEIAAGQSRYQIASQPKYKAKSSILGNRRGDLTLLINGMPLIHIELKKTGIPVSQAVNQIEKYSFEGVFTGLFSLVQIFVAMTPEETLYFANPGPDGKFNKDYQFHWADINNDQINDWSNIASSLLSIPMAHQLIGFYTVADNTDGVLKVMRSYQYYAASAISDRVSKINKDGYDGINRLGGYVWHTTGSGKTMTSFKSAQLIATSKDADKVVFLVDRIELGTQSLKHYRGFATDSQTVQKTENTGVLITKLKSSDSADTLIVTSIQKMSNIKNDEDGANISDLEIMNTKRIVFIIDECHRSTFGDMLCVIKETFPTAIFFGFSGTPILDENAKKMNTSSDVFGDEISNRYTIADGIKDGNVLGFDPYKITTFKDNDIRQAVALEKVKATSLDEVYKDPKKSEIFYKYMDSAKIKMAGYRDETGKYIKGIEDELNKVQYENEDHQRIVVEDIKSNWQRLSVNNKFHAIFATSSIPEAIDYYRLIKHEMPNINITCLFDPHISNEDGNFKEYKGLKVAEFKELGLVEILEDYNEKFEQKFSIPNHAKFKEDLSARLSHKEPYKSIERENGKQIDLLIVVDQMLTGFDSKWINTLYLDKVLKYENIIQAFSRTNRLYGPDKPYGVIRYYRFPHTMEQNIENAVQHYSGDKPFGLFVNKLESNLTKLNEIFNEIQDLFSSAGYPDFDKLPDEKAEKAQFAKLFNEFNTYLEAAKIQGFVWDKQEYTFEHEDSQAAIVVEFSENIYLTLAIRYKELIKAPGGGNNGDVPFDINGYLIEIDTGKIDNDYMNYRFDKYRRSLEQENISKEEQQSILNELHKSFAVLTQEEQKHANIFLHDIEAGNIKLESGKTFREYVLEYQSNTKNNEITHMAEILGLDIIKLSSFMNGNVTESNINEYGRFDELKESVNRELAKDYFEKTEDKTLKTYEVPMRIEKLLREFILQGGFDINNNSK